MIRNMLSFSFRISTRGLLITLLTAISFLSACESEDPDAIAAENRKEIVKFIEEQGLTDVAFEYESSGLFYVIDDPGYGNHPTLSSQIRIRYVGSYTDEKVFDSSSGALIVLQNTIRGWQIGIPLFKNGGKGKLFIPSSLGYGSYPPYGSGIRRNAVLIFEFEIIDIS